MTQCFFSKIRQGLLHQSDVEAHHQAGRCVAEVVFVAEKGDVIPLFGEVAFITDVGGKPPASDGQAGLPAPGHLFPAGCIAVEIGEFRFAAQEIVPDGAAVKTQRTGAEAHEQGQVYVLIPLVFDDFADARFADHIVHFIGVENEFGLKKHRITDAGINTELGSELDFIDAKIERGIAAADGDVVGFDGLGIQSAFDTKRELSLGAECQEEHADYKKQIFHTSVQGCVSSKTALQRAWYTSARALTLH